MGLEVFLGSVTKKQGGWGLILFKSYVTLTFLYFVLFDRVLFFPFDIIYITGVQTSTIVSQFVFWLTPSLMLSRKVIARNRIITRFSDRQGELYHLFFHDYEWLRNVWKDFSEKVKENLHWLLMLCFFTMREESRKINGYLHYNNLVKYHPSLFLSNGQQTV